jgi:hypothetical protein
MTRLEIQTLIDNISDGVPNTALKVRTVLNAIADGAGVTGDVKELDVSTGYITANFDPTGLGINERLGWAICNGNNGTRNRQGRVPMQYSTSYPTLGATGGSADAVVISHNHLNGVANEQVATFVYGGTTSGMPGSATFSVAEDGGARTYQGSTSNSGETGVGKNMQPYIVTLMIQKL